VREQWCGQTTRRNLAAPFMASQMLQPGADDRAIHEVMQEIASSAPPQLPQYVNQPQIPQQPTQQQVTWDRQPPAVRILSDSGYSSSPGKQLIAGAVDIDDVKRAALIALLYALTLHPQLQGFLASKISNPMMMMAALSIAFGITAVLVSKYIF
jgi:hypothetical protein